MSQVTFLTSTNGKLFILLEKIGNGAFANVYECQCISAPVHMPLVAKITFKLADLTEP